MCALANNISFRCARRANLPKCRQKTEEFPVYPILRARLRGAFVAALKLLAAPAPMFTLAPLVALLAMPALAGPIGDAVRSDVDRHLYRIDMATGEAIDLGLTGFSKLEGLAISPAGELYGVNPPTAQLVKCLAATGACTLIGPLSGLPPLQTNAGLTFATNGTLYLAMNAVIYRVDPNTGATVALGGTGPALAGLAAIAPSDRCPSGVYGMGGNSDRGRFYCVNTDNGSTTLLGTLTMNPLDVGLDGDAATGLVWGVSNDTPGQVFSVDPVTLTLDNIHTVKAGATALGGFESLAVARSGTQALGDPYPLAAQQALVVPTLQPALLALLSLLLVAAAVSRRRSVHVHE